MPVKLDRIDTIESISNWNSMAKQIQKKRRKTKNERERERERERKRDLRKSKRRDSGKRRCIRTKLLGKKEKNVN
jgi:hypothetical protein